VVLPTYRLLGFGVCRGAARGDVAYMSTIDGAYRCDNFLELRCLWRIMGVYASSAVPYFVAGGYIPGPSDGWGEPQP